MVRTSRARARMGAMTIGVTIAMTLAAANATANAFANVSSASVIESYDGDLDGKLNANEMLALFEAMSEGAHAKAHRKKTTMTAEDVTRASDVDGDGATSASEFAVACAAIATCAMSEECEFEMPNSESGGELVGFKAAMGAAIFAEAVVGGIAPMALAGAFALRYERVDVALGLMNAFSGGVFLSAGLVHILPHVLEAGEGVTWSPPSYPLPFVLVLIGYMLIFFVERVVFHTHGHSSVEDHFEVDDRDRERDDVEDGTKPTPEASHAHAHGHEGHGHEAKEATAPKSANKRVGAGEFRAPFMLILAISLHAVLEGMSLGVQSSRESVTAVAVAIMSHKAPAAFSMGFALYKSGVNTYFRMCAIILTFACVTPLGIAIGIAVGSSSPTASFVLDGLAGGTFIYIGTTEIATDEFETSPKRCDHKHGAHTAPGSHSHIEHQAPLRGMRLLKFFAYSCGVGVILCAALAVDGH